MIVSNSLVSIFAVAMMGCVFATPLVTKFAHWAGAIDRPDKFRRVHKNATPRLGGLGLALGVAAGAVLVVARGAAEVGGDLIWRARALSVLAASLLVLVIGFVDDTRGIRPRVKLLGQAAAVLVLFAGGISIQSIDVLRLTIDLTHPSVSLEGLGIPAAIALPSLAVTLFWFLGCMNIWNLIDGMDGLASGVGLLVSGTLALVAIHNQNLGVAVMATALAGSLAGFLLYNWHPACIFLGDSGSLLIGLLIGVIGVQGSMKGPSAISLLFPILAMGLPISDTLLAIFRRWVRNLPLSAADRRHVHHLLIGLGLNPWQAALLLYCFSGFLCGAVLLGVALRNEKLALAMGLSGCLAFVLIVTSRMNELAELRGDFLARLARGRQERFAAKTAWEAIQRIELCTHPLEVYAILHDTARLLACESVELTSAGEAASFPMVSAKGPAGTSIAPFPPLSSGGQRAGSPDGVTTPMAPSDGGPPTDLRLEREENNARESKDKGRSNPSFAAVSGTTAIFRLFGGQDLTLTVSLLPTATANVAPDIAFRFLQRLALVGAERLEQLLDYPDGAGTGLDDEPVDTTAEESAESLAFAGIPTSLREASPDVGPNPGWRVAVQAIGWKSHLTAQPPSLGIE
jgi:UDP-GlcNAc:undecaprenyl-phosphate GlcNAc-1-phosphate transferase